MDMMNGPIWNKIIQYALPVAVISNYRLLINNMLTTIIYLYII